MHPAPSIILFTTASGLGYGLAAMLGLGLVDPASVSAKVAHVLALALIGGGLLSSTLHLGNPQRAWRAFSQWRSSWLSREGVMALVTFMPLVLSAWFVVVEGRYSPVAGLVGAALCAVTVYCTAMIYASLKAVDAWHTPLTPAFYLLFALAGGLVASVFFATTAGGAGRWLIAAAMCAVAVAWGVKLVWRGRLASAASTSTPESATGLGHIGRVRLLERPHMTENYLTREMGFRVARKHARKLFVIALVAGAALPFVLLGGSLAAGPGGAASLLMAGMALLSFGFGTLVERWLFFAEARHAVMSYYGG